MCENETLNASLVESPPVIAGADEFIRIRKGMYVRKYRNI